MKSITITVLFFIIINAKAQNAGIGTTTPNNSARLEVVSTTQGFLPPRLTVTQRDSIVNPATGLTIYCIQCGELQVFSNGSWKSVTRDSVCKEVKICDQIWMGKNLDVDTYRNGDTIPQVTDETTWQSLTTGAWCYYNNDPALGAIYGKLYNWYAVNDPRGLAPEGFHVPTKVELTTLSTCLGGDAVSGGKMKKTSTNHWQSPNTGANNSSGFTGLPSGFRDDIGGGFYNLGVIGLFWTSSEWTDIYTAWSFYLLHNDNNLFTGVYAKWRGYAVRCLRDSLPNMTNSGDCVPGYAKCSALPSDGCNTNLRNDNNNCGACGRACGPGKTCVNGVCQ